MWSLIKEYEISTKIVNDLFDGVETDLKNKVQINSKKELFIYSYRLISASKMASFEYLGIPSSFVLGWIFFKKQVQG